MPWLQDRLFSWLSKELSYTTLGSNVVWLIMKWLILRAKKLGINVLAVEIECISESLQG